SPRRLAGGPPYGPPAPPQGGGEVEVRVRLHSPDSSRTDNAVDRIVQAENREVRLESGGRIGRDEDRHPAPAGRIDKSEHGLVNPTDRRTPPRHEGGLRINTQHRY